MGSRGGQPLAAGGKLWIFIVATRGNVKGMCRTTEDDGWYDEDTRG